MGQGWDQVPRDRRPSYMLGEDLLLQHKRETGAEARHI